MHEKIVYIIDDDAEVIRVIEWLLKSVKIKTRSFQNPHHFLNIIDELTNGCILLDVRMPHMSGMELLKILSEKQVKLPVIIITLYGDIPMAVQAIKLGAVDFISKPFNDQLLLDLIQRTLSSEADTYSDALQFEETAKLYMSLTDRERQVLSLVVEGNLNKQIAQELGIAISTVEMHRSNIMQKLQVNNIAQLIKKTVLLKL